MQNLRSWVILSAFLISQGISFSQPEKPVFEKLSIQEGLSNSTIYCLYQDINGFIWIGTKDGLNRYIKAAFFKEYFF